MNFYYFCYHQLQINFEKSILENPFFMDPKTQNHIESLQILFPKYTKDELQSFYMTRESNFEKTCTFLITQMHSPMVIPGKHKRQALSSPQQETIDKVMKMVTDHNAQQLAKKYDMNISTVTWEDCSRNKNSCWGPCICDMTLRVPENNCLPVIRYPNFNDMTWDIPIEKVFLMIGNENGDTPLRKVSLKYYLGPKLYCKERDSHVLVSAQACLLPAAPGSEPTFNIALYSYQSYSEDDPAVLAIIASAQGSSAQTVGERTQKLYFNNNGRKASFVGQRLSDNRKERGVANDDLNKPMTSEEKEANMLMLIQVPLKQKERPPMRGLQAMSVCKESWTCDGYDFIDEEDFGEICESADFEDVIVKISDKDEGPFPDIKYNLQRDTRYPIRITLQFYKATSNGILDYDTMFNISKQFVTAQQNADFIGSLVTGNILGDRPTTSQK